MEQIVSLFIFRGVDNGAAGAAAAAPLIWLVVVIQKWRTFRRPKQFFLCIYKRVEGPRT